MGIIPFDLGGGSELGGPGTQFADAIQSRAFALLRRVEIEGIPYGYGTADEDADFFTDRDEDQRMEGIRKNLAAIPSNIDSELDLLDGIASSKGQAEVLITDIDGQPTIWTGVGVDSGIALAADITAT